MIPFNRPYLTGKETQYIQDAVASGKISGDGLFTKKCHDYFQSRFGFSKCLLTTSCTDALEMAAILLDIEPGDEVIVPSYTFVSTANAFVLRGAKIVFADSGIENPNIDVDLLEGLITSRTKAIVAVHYAGVACDMDALLQLCSKHSLFLIEDAAQAIDSYYKGRPLGSFGHMAAFSFHETKNIVSGEGGMLVVNDSRFAMRAEIIREKGTNRSAFFRGEVDKYGWVDIGSSFLPSDIIAAFLFAQLENLERIQERRIKIWNTYYENLIDGCAKGYFRICDLPKFASNNGHMFYIVTNSLEDRTRVIDICKKENVHLVFHYLSLHDSPYYARHHDGRALPFASSYSNRVVRLPFYFELTPEEQQRVISLIYSAF